ncbi:endo alpha-1,4 polygalactosaminidase [Rathayibacter sp. VKM Ac-2801]|uniref:endo alpha-1,4 polygalactosaminidase n=1 Tax=Rathayibacter sp. VKM Ac-2801 TaxID=2609255 RepID=UPI0013200B9B|nr:endo alpha-1,4 polygalactosaminidase [Rathayibacter sp. VKM Ac-2801]QHC70574.1 hypothetical protein GSU45_09485 [Rathayibacter sp. VKM Ac-2801]
MRPRRPRLGLLALVVAGLLLVQPAAASAAPLLPPANGVLDYQLGGAYAPASSVTIVDRDRTDPPAAGRYSICYVNAFQTQPGESAAFAKRHPELLVRRADGKPLADPGWPDEYLFDVSTSAKRTALLAIVGAWIDGCAEDGFDAVEADNLDSYTRSGGRLTTSQALAFATLLTARAHRSGLAIGQKNGADHAAAGRRTVGFDFAVVEECQVYDECAAYTDVYGRQVYEIEYTDNGRSAYAEACAEQGRRISVTLRDRDVVPRGATGYVNRHC